MEMSGKIFRHLQSDASFYSVQKSTLICGKLATRVVWLS